MRIHDRNENGGIFSETWSSCHNLEELYVNDNRQTSISPRTLRNCKKLRVLDVSNNKISKVSQINSLLKELPNLERLVLQGNPIAALPDLTSSSLTLLDLSYCNLNIVGEKTFAKLRKLHTLNLEGNKLKKFKSTLPGSLRVLSLVLNDIATISPVENFSKLKVLELAGNPLQCSCDLVRLRNEDTAEFVSFRQEATCAGPKTMRGLSWVKARRHCDLDHLSRRQRRDLDDLEEEGSGFDGDENDNLHLDGDQEGNADDDDDGEAADGDNEIEEEEEDSGKDSDPITAPVEEKTESPGNEGTELVDSKLFGTVEEPDKTAQGNVGSNLFETDHSTTSTTEHEFIPHEDETDDDTKATKEEEDDDTTATKEEETVVGSVSENGDPKVDSDSDVTENDETEDTGSDKQADKNEEEEEEEDGDDDDEIIDPVVPEKELPDQSENSEVNAGEEETGTDDKEEEEEEESNINYDTTGSEDENVNKKSEKEEDGEDKEKGDNISENDNNDGYDEYEDLDKVGDEKPEESSTENTPLAVGDEVEEDKGVDVNESWGEGNQHSADETSTSKLNVLDADIDEASGSIGESEEDADISPIIAPDDDNDAIPSVEDTIDKETAVDVGSDKKTDSETETGLEEAVLEGSGSDSEDSDTTVGPNTKNVTVGHVGRGRHLFLGVPGVKEGGDEEVSQATTQPGPEVSQDGEEIIVVSDTPDSEEDKNNKISLEPSESPVTSTGSYVVLGLIMVLIVFLLGYAVYKSRVGRRRTDSDSRTIKEKDLELGKGNDRELQDVSKPLLLTTPAAAVNGKSELQQPLVSKPTENPQLKDDAEDKKKNSPLPSRYAICRSPSHGTR